MVVQVDENRCNGCGICVEACPVDAITVDQVAKINAAICTGCGSCMEECPNDAISMERMDVSAISPPPTPLPPVRPAAARGVPLPAPARSSAVQPFFSRVNWAAILGLAFDLFIGRLATRGRGQNFGRGEGCRGGMGRGRGRRR